MVSSRDYFFLVIGYQQKNWIIDGLFSLKKKLLIKFRKYNAYINLWAVPTQNFHLLILNIY